MTLSLLIFIAGLITLSWCFIGFCLLGRTIGEKVFTEERPIWLVLICWAYMTLALLAWTYFYQAAQPVSFLAAGILTISAAKFIFFYISYSHWRRAFVYIWDRRIIFVIILGCGTAAGIFMLIISSLIS
jgi:hypothetical protein